MVKARFLETLLDERTKFEHLVNRVHGSRITICGAVGRWSVKDTLAHIMAYEQYLADRMAEHLRGASYRPSCSQSELDDFVRRFGYPDFGSPVLDERNADEWIVERYKSIPLEDVVACENQVFLSIFAAVERFDETDLTHNNWLQRVASNTCEHYQAHFEQISEWLESVR